VAAAAPPAGSRSLPRRRLLPSLAAARAVVQAEQGERRRRAPRAAEHRDAGERRLRGHSPERHLEPRRPGLSGGRPLLFWPPLPMEKAVAIIFAVTNGFLDDVPVDKVQAFEAAFHPFMDSNHPEWLAKVRDEKQLSDETSQQLRDALNEFKQSVPY